jgi:hypothetical protein
VDDDVLAGAMLLLFVTVVLVVVVAIVYTGITATGCLVSIELLTTIVELFVPPIT